MLTRNEVEIWTPCLALLLAIGGNVGAQQDAPVVKEFALVGVHVVPMDREEILRGRTVIVRNGRIAAIEESGDVDLEAGIERIDGQGRYLLPGLADMHVHLEYFEREEDLVLFPLAGVTSVRAMDGRSEHLEWRSRVAAGELLGPRIVTAGRIIDGQPPFWDDSLAVANAEEARAAVRAQKLAGYDSVKVYQQLSREAFAAVVAEARFQGMPVDGHVPAAVGLDAVLAAGMRCIEHLRGYPQAVESDNAPLRGQWHWSKLYFHVDRDETKTREVVKRTVEAGTWNCPTLIVNQKHVPLPRMREWLQDPFLQYLPSSLTAMWDPEQWDADRRRQAEYMGDDDFALIAQGNATARLMVRRLHEAGAGIVLGTDTPNPFVVPGRAVHEELALLVEAGLTPYQALRTATVEAARFLGEAGQWGIVAVGGRADLLLVAGDPVQDIANIRKVDGVSVAGRWLSRRDLDGLLADLKR